MDFKIETHKLVKELLKIKLSSLIILIAFVSSFNLWFLSLYFFKPDFIEIHGLIITLLTTFALTTTWFITSIITVPKSILLSIIITFDNIDVITEEFNNGEEESEKKLVNTFVFANTIILHAFFVCLTYFFNINFNWYVGISFGCHIALYSLTNLFLQLIIILKGEEKHITEKQEDDQDLSLSVFDDLEKNEQEIKSKYQEVGK